MFKKIVNSIRCCYPYKIKIIKVKKGYQYEYR